MRNKSGQYTPIPLKTYSKSGRVQQHYLHYKNVGCKYYFCSQHIMYGLNNKERSFFDFLCEKMQERDNSILIDRKLKDDYLNFITTILPQAPRSSISILDKAIKKFVEKKLIFLLGKSKGYYTVNPKYVFKGSESSRKIFVSTLIESRRNTGLEIDFLLNLPVEHFYQDGAK